MSSRPVLSEAEIYGPDCDGVSPQIGRQINERACGALAQCSGGRFPATTAHWRHVGDTLGIRIRLVSPDVLPEPLIRYDDETRSAGTLYLPSISSRPRLYFWLLHEMSETAMKRGDLGPEFRYPCAWGDHHAMACLVETYHTRPATLSGPLSALEP